MLNFAKPYLQVLDDAWQLHLAPRAVDAPTFISVFAGCGGSSLGYSMAGYRELLAVEWDNIAVETFKRNFIDVPVFHDDIAKLSVKDAMRLAGIKEGEIDVLDGSPPCQGFSDAGRRDFQDVRNQLYKEYVRLLRGLKPKCFIMENVSGMVRGKMKLIFSDIMHELKASGYNVRARLLNAMYFGVPQSRKRMIFIGVRNDLVDKYNIGPSHPKAKTWPITTWQAIGHLGNKQEPSRGHIWIDESPCGRNTKTWAMAARTKPGGDIVKMSRRARWNRPSYTLLTGRNASKPYIRNIGCHPEFTRTFSLLEYRLLSSFPESFILANDYSSFKLIGNCVPPLFMQAIAEHVHNSILNQT